MAVEVHCYVGIICLFWCKSHDEDAICGISCTLKPICLCMVVFGCKRNGWSVCKILKWRPRVIILTTAQQFLTCTRHTEGKIKHLRTVTIFFCYWSFLMSYELSKHWILLHFYKSVMFTALSWFKFITFVCRCSSLKTIWAVSLFRVGAGWSVMTREIKRHIRGASQMEQVDLVTANR